MEVVHVWKGCQSQLFLSFRKGPTCSIGEVGTWDEKPLDIISVIPHRTRFSHPQSPLLPIAFLATYTYNFAPRHCLT